MNPPPRIAIRPFPAIFATAIILSGARLGWPAPAPTMDARGLGPGTQTVNALLGDSSFLAAFGRPPAPGTDEDLRIRIHLRFVERLLRARDVSALDPAVRAARRRGLDLLAEYAAAGTFPRNHDHPGERRPCFIDRDGRICAVGYLIERTAGRALAETINAGWQYALLGDMDAPLLDGWIASSGFTPLELALIQPCYGCPVERECMALSGQTWTTAAFPPGETFEAVALADLARGILDSTVVLGEVTFHLGPLDFERSYRGPLVTTYNYRSGPFGIYDDPQWNAVYANQPPNAATPGTFLDGEALLTGIMSASLYYDHRSQTFAYFSAYGELTGGSQRDEFVTPFVSLSGILASGSALGYDFSADLTLIGTCGNQPDPVEPATWGKIKAAYR